MLGCKDAAKDEPAPVAQAEDPAAVHPEIWPSQMAFAKDEALEERSVAAQEDDGRGKGRPGHPGDICCIKPEDMKQYHLGSILPAAVHRRQ
jgi:hypothetical protein